MKFGKTLLRQQIPEYGASYINYKALKKVIKSLAAGSENETLVDQNGRQQTRLQANKATFFFKLTSLCVMNVEISGSMLKSNAYSYEERELDKVNAFYLRKEAELKNRLSTLLDKKLLLQAGIGADSRTSANFIVLQEGFQQFERDLNKLQQYVELNATGFYKVLKKWDKRSKSHTKELYLSRRVEIQPVFNRDMLSNLVDTATSALLELEAHANGDDLQHVSERQAQASPNLRAMAVRTEDELDSDILRCVTAQSQSTSALTEVMAKLTNQPSAGHRLTRVFMQALSTAPDSSLEALAMTNLIDFNYEDEISGRICLHEAVLSGRLFPLELCLAHKSDLGKVDVYGRTALHYACMQGTRNEKFTNLLLNAGSPANSLDHNISAPLHYAIINGRIDCVKTLLQFGADVNPKTESDYIPLSMACARGHIDIAKLLLENGAKILHNAEGLWPLHLVARAGHTGFCALLLKHGSELEVRDKFSGWTPLFFAASEGHSLVLKELIDSGASVDVRDEDHHSPTYYAAWEGYKSALQTLLSAGGAFGNTESAARMPVRPKSPPSLAPDSLDDIPSLLLPPPILPVRSYGHNYLDNATFVQITFLGPTSNASNSPVSWYLDETLFSSSKLTVSLKSTKRNSNFDLIPHTVSLPIMDDSESYIFQVEDLDHLCLEFEIYPTFGSKVIAKGVALPHLFQDPQRARVNGGLCVVPLLDPRLQSIGQVSFEYTVIRPFSGIHFDIHSRIETYWKSTQAIEGPTPRAQVQSLVTESSLSGQYIWIPVQVTKDRVAVIYADWHVPLAELRLGVSDVTFEQLTTICARKWNKANTISDLINSHTAEDIQKIIRRCFLTLSEFLFILENRFNLHIQVLLPTVSERKYLELNMVADINVIVDSILSTVFQHVERAKQSKLAAKQSLFFSSCNSVVCTALNWKQPNYPVFLAHHLGHSTGQDTLSNTFDISPHGLPTKEHDRRSSSIKEAVKFARVNNLLGLIIDASTAVHAPALITTIKESGLVLVTHGATNADKSSIDTQVLHGVDGIMSESSILTLLGKGIDL